MFIWQIFTQIKLSKSRKKLPSCSQMKLALTCFLVIFSQASSIANRSKAVPSKFKVLAWCYEYFDYQAGVNFTDFWSWKFIDTKNVCSDSSLMSADQSKSSSFFGCIPPESGLTVFAAWWFDVYHPDEEFNQRGRDEIHKKVKSIPKEEREKLAHNEETTRFLVVRHPLTRFVSAWVEDHKLLKFRKKNVID